MGRAVCIAFKRDGGHCDRWAQGKAFIKIVILTLAVGQAEPPAIIVNDDAHVVGVIKGPRAALECGIVEIPFWGRQFPNEFVEISSVFVIARAAALGRKIELVPPFEFSLRRRIVNELRKLYLIERHARDRCLDPAARLKLRQELSAPILVAIKPRLQSILPGCLPQSPLGKAIKYALAEWEALNRYLEDGRLEIDNNLTENAIRPSAVGKKNWLFIGHPEAGWRSAVIYSVIVSCRRRGIDPWEYVRDVLNRLPAMKQAQLPTLLPRCWKPAER